jgi:hypothetical protein
MMPDRDMRIGPRPDFRASFLLHCSEIDPRNRRLGARCARVSHALGRELKTYLQWP